MRVSNAAEIAGRYTQGRTLELACDAVRCAISFCYHRRKEEADMPQLLVRNLDEGTITRLKALAKRHGRSLQGQVKIVLEEAATLPAGEVSALVQEWQRRLARRRFSDSARIIRKDRGR
ncbi:MAG: hypothetical protein ACHQ7N_11635 [Candidatus Methylomirabilales bacterium]